MESRSVPCAVVQTMALCFFRLSAGYFSDVRAGSLGQTGKPLSELPEACDRLHKALSCEGGRAAVRSRALWPLCLPPNVASPLTSRVDLDAYVTLCVSVFSSEKRESQRSVP